MITTDDLIESARKYLGVKFKHQGRTSSGLDCAGLLIVSLKDLGVNPVDRTDYSIEPNPPQMLEVIESNCYEIPKNNLKPGDVIWLKFLHDPQHLGLVTDVGIIHAYSTRKGVVEHAINKAWERRIMKAFRIKAVTYE